MLLQNKKVKKNGEHTQKRVLFFFSHADGTSAVHTAAVCGGRTFPAELLDSGDMECSLCMR